MLPLVFYALEPHSLREVAKHTPLDRVGSVIGTLSIGISLIAVAAVTFDANGVAMMSSMEHVVGLSRDGVLKQGRYFQILSSSVVHVNVVHLISNLATLALLSVYERRVG